VQAAEFLVQHAGPRLDWDTFPIVLSDGRKLLLRDARREAQCIVVPENMHPDNGWQHIWLSSQDRSHFRALDRGYSRLPSSWFQARSIPSYPGFARQTYSRRWPQQIPPVGTPEFYLFDQSEDKAARSRFYDTQLVSSVLPSSLVPKPDASGVDSRLVSSLLGLLSSLEIPDEDFYLYKQQMYQLGLYAKATYHNYGEYEAYGHSSVLQRLRNLSWLPSSKGHVIPSQAFLPKQAIRDVFGDTVPYSEARLPEQSLRALGVRPEVTTEQLLSLLHEQSGTLSPNREMVERIYSQLAARPRSVTDTFKARFSTEGLILTKDAHAAHRWGKTGDCVWEDASAVFGDAFAYLVLEYPKLQEFFVERLGVKRQVDTESFAQRWLKLQEAPLADIEQQRDLVGRLYREIRPVTQKLAAERPVWWTVNFAKRVKVYTQSDMFEHPSRVVLPDDGELREIFRGKQVQFGWRPEKDSFSDWMYFYLNLGTRMLSTAVTEHLQEVSQLEYAATTRFLTEAAVKMIAAWLRERRKNDYERLLDSGALKQLATLREAKTPVEVKVEFRLHLDAVDESITEARSAFWDRQDNVLIYAPTSKPSQIAKAVAKGLVSGLDYKDLCHWVELVLEAPDTDRLKDEGWSVPQPILELFPQRTAVSGTPAREPAARDATPIVPTSGLDSGLTAGAAPGVPAFDATPIDSGSAELAAVGTITSAAGQPEEAARPPEPVAKHGDASQGGPIRSPELVDQGGRSHDEGRIPSKGEQKPPHEEPPVTPKTGKQEGSEDGSIPGGEPRELSFARELQAAFTRDGVTRFVDEQDRWEEDSGKFMVRHPQRRSERLTDQYSEAIRNEPEAEDRRRVTEMSLLEGPSEAVRVALDEWYQGKCQICYETWPKQDGQPYFTAAYLVERQHARWLDTPGNAVCLCAEHFAQWRHAAKSMPLDVVEQIRSLRLRSEGGRGDLSIEFTMLGEDVAIHYDERHLLALRTLLNIASPARAETSSAPVLVERPAWPSF